MEERKGFKEMAEEDPLSSLRQRLARDVNSLSDPERAKRRRGLKGLERGLFGKVG